MKVMFGRGQSAGYGRQAIDLVLQIIEFHIHPIKFQAEIPDRQLMGRNLGLKAESIDIEA